MTDMLFAKKKKLSNQPRQYHRNPRQKQAVFSYSSSRRESVNSHKNSRSATPQKHLSKVSLLAKLQMIIFGAVLLVGATYLVSLDREANVRVEGEQSFIRDNSEYINAVNTELNKSWQNKSKLTIKSQSISQSIKSQFPEVRSVSIRTSLFRHKPSVKLQLTKPTARLVKPDATYVLDSEGNALFDAGKTKASFNTNDLIPITDNSTYSIQIGKPAVTEDQISYIKEIIRQFQDKNIPIKEMSLEAGGLELHVKLKDKAYFVKFSFLSDARQSSGAYITIRKNNVPANQYIDVRLPERVYVK
jgi:hypothetical protein